MQDETAASAWLETAGDKLETFESAFRHAAIGMALVSPQGRFLQVNDALCEIVGYEEAQLLTTTFQSITHPDDLELDLSHVKSLLSGEIDSYQMEKRYIHSGGHEVPVLLSVSLVHNNGEPRYFISQIQDISERKRVEHSLNSLTGLLSTLINNLHDGLIAEDMEGKVTLANRPLCTIFNLQRNSNDLIGIDSKEAFREIGRFFNEADQSVERLDRMRLRGQAVIDEILVAVDGRTFERDYTPIFVETEQQGHLWVYRDVSEKRREQESIEAQALELQTVNAKLETLAATDDLTRIGNRRAFMERLDEEVRRTLRSGDPLSLLMLDVDHFKSFNDSYGHPAGDEVLKIVAQLLQNNARTTDYVARYGGEEFAVILPQTDNTGALHLAERFRQVIETHNWSRRVVTISAGVSTCTPHDDTFDPGHNTTKTEGAREDTSGGNGHVCVTKYVEAIIAAADVGLYRSKSSGRNRVSFESIATDISDSSETVSP